MTASDENQLRKREVLKATGLIGSSSMINMLIGFIRNKAIALLLGTAGTGVLGLYTQLTNSALSLCNLGLAQSAVKFLAESYDGGDQVRLRRLIHLLNLMGFVTGAFAILLFAALCYPLSLYSFGSPAYTLPVALLGINTALTLFAGIESSIIQGTRRIRDLALANVAGAAAGTLVSLPCYWLWGEDGIITGLILGAAASLAVNFFFARRATPSGSRVTFAECRPLIRPLLMLGGGFFGANLVWALSNAFMQSYLIRELGADAGGIFRAAFTLSALLATFILNAMGTEFFPRLCGVSQDDEAMRKMVRVQLDTVVCLGLPGVMVMMGFGSLLITVFYSAEFASAEILLRIFSFGIFTRLVAFPIGYIIPAKGKSKIYFYVELVLDIIHIGAWIGGIYLWGVVGTAVAFVVQTLGVLVSSAWYGKKLCGFGIRNWFRIALYGYLVLLLLFVNVTWNSHMVSKYAVSVFLTVGVGVFCLHRLVHSCGFRFPGKLSVLNRLIK